MNIVRYTVYTIYCYACALFNHATNKGQFIGIESWFVMLGLFQMSPLAWSALDHSDLTHISVTAVHSRQR